MLSICTSVGRHLNDLKVAGVDENEPIFVSKRIVRNVIFTLSTLYIDASKILVIALIVLLLWGGKKIPELMHGLGKGVKSFKDGMNEVTNFEEEKKETPEKKDE